MILQITVQIIDEEAPSPLGRKTCLELGLIERIMTMNQSDCGNNGDDILNQYPDLFTGLGCIKSSAGSHHIEVDPNINPVVHPPRKVPAALRLRIQKELQRMEDLGVIEKQSEPTSSVNSIVTVIKPHKLRICIDPRDLNHAIRRENHPLPTVEEVVSRLPNAWVFSILDASSGFWQIELMTAVPHCVPSTLHLDDTGSRDFHLVFRLLQIFSESYMYDNNARGT